MEIKFVAFTERRDNNKNYLVIRKFPVPLTGETKEFEIELPPHADPLVFFTATTGMIETIGNMVDECNAVGYAFGNQRHEFKVQNPLKIPAKKRVYITEHLRLDGKPDGRCGIVRSPHRQAVVQRQAPAVAPRGRSGGARIPAGGRADRRDRP